MKDPLKLVEFFSAMSAVDRFSQYRLINPESILEHTGMVAITTMMICKMIDADEDTELQALRHALCHDMDEILTGDIPMPTKYSSQSMKSMIDNVADDNMMQIDIDYGTEFTNDWRGSGVTRAIVKLADVIAVYYKARQEIDLFGNILMKKAIGSLYGALGRSSKNLEEYYPGAQALYELVDEMMIWVEFTERG